MSAKRLFLLDAYALIYRSYYAFIKNPRFNSKGQNTSAIYGFTNTLFELIRKENPSHLSVVFDPPGATFRNDMYPEYKANREATPEDIKLSVPYIKQLIEAFNIHLVEIPKYEADDTIGTLAKQAEKEGFEVFMMTPDKDYGQLVSEHVKIYKPARGGNDAEVLGVSEINARYSIESPMQVIDILALMGDASDNVPGAPGIGEKTAIKLIDQFQSVENLLDNTAELKGKQKEKIEDNVDQIKLSKDLVTIRTDVPVQFDAAAFEIQEMNKETLTGLFNELEFKTFGQRILGAQNSSESIISSTDSAQGSLFEQAFEASPAAASNLKTVDTVPHAYYLVDTDSKRADLVEQLKNSTAFSFDTETTGLDWYTAQMVGMSFCFKSSKAYYVPVPEDQDETRRIVQMFQEPFLNKNITKIGQNIKFDMLMIRKYGVKMDGPLFDTMIAHYLIQPDLRHNLDFLCEIYLEYKTISIDTLIGPKGKNQKSMREAHIEDLVEYAAEDADMTYQLKEKLAQELKDQTLMPLFEDMEMPLIYVLTEIELAGFKINSNDLNEYAEQLRHEAIEVEASIHEDAGMPFNVASPKQLGEILYEKLKIVDNPKKTKTKQYSTSEETLVKMLDKHPIIQKILDFRSLKKLLSTYVEVLPTLIHGNTGKIHTSYNQAVAATGRLSSNKPNLQNIPIREARGKEIRKAFIASEPSMKLLAADYSQIELRLMAHMSEDQQFLDAFNHEKDVHSATAAKIFKVSLDDVDADMRRKAKTANFGIIYGISAFGLSQRLNIPRTEAKQLIDGYFESYPGIKAFMDQSIAFARDEGYVKTLLGRKRLLPDINSRNAIVRGIAERNAINAPIQGSAADIIKLAMINIHKKFESEKLKSKMILQVHDELIFDVYEDETDKVQTIVRQEMENAYQIKVPLTVDVGLGTNWLEAH